MPNWKPFLAIVATGLLLGYAAAEFVGPDRLHDLYDAEMAQLAAPPPEPVRPIYDGAPEDPAPNGYAYRVRTADGETYWVRDLAELQQSAAAPPAQDDPPDSAEAAGDRAADAARDAEAALSEEAPLPDPAP